MPIYSAYSLAFQLPFACPVLPFAPPDVAPDVVVEDGEVPFQLPAPSAGGEQWQAEVKRFLWRGGPRAGRFLVEDGQRITLQRSATAEEEMLGFHFLDRVLAAILRQRGLLVLHANAALTRDGAVAIAGESGTGKSTTLAALLARGCKMLADDIVALHWGQNGCVEALPGVPRLHLAEDAAERLKKDIAGLPRHPWRPMKAAVPAHSEMADQSAPLRALYVLEKDAGNTVNVQGLNGAQKFATLQECVYGPMLPNEHPVQFSLFAATAQQVAVFRVQRPAERWTLHELIGKILNG